MPLVSFVIPIYNSEVYLRQCLDSILAQTNGDFEAILVDDGSKDESGVICDEYAHKDKRFKVIHKRNEGLSAARNDGILLARGEWLAFVDSDDWIEPCSIEVLSANKEYDYIITSINHHKVGGKGEADRFIECCHMPFSSAVFSETNYKIAFFTAWSKFFRTQIVKENNLIFTLDVSPGEDTIFVFQYLRHVKSMYMSARICYNWRVANGLTNRKRTFDKIIYTIDQTIIAIKGIEEKYDVDLSHIKINNIHYLIDRIDINSYSYWELYLNIKNIAEKEWINSLVSDKTYIRKGRRLHLIDCLIRIKGYALLALICKLRGQLY